MLLTTTDPGHIGFRLEPDDVVALSFLVGAFCIALVAWTNWWLDHLWQPAILAVDILVFIALPSLIEPAFSGFRIASLTTATFIILSVSIRWDWKSAAQVAIALNLLNLLLSTLQPVSTFLPVRLAIDESPQHEYVRNLFYFLLISLLVVWLGRRITALRSARFQPASGLSAEKLLELGLQFLADGIGARTGAFCWQRRDRSACTLVTTGALPRSIDGAEIECGLDEEDIAVAWLFDVEHRRALELTKQGKVVAARLREDPPAAMMRQGAHEGVDIPIAGASGQGRIVLSDLRAPSADMLTFLSTAVSEVVVALDRQQASLLSREKALARIRQTLARDLHDSVAQTLAGMRFWLRSLRGRPLSRAELDLELARIDEVLSEESRALRAVIDRLRDDAEPLRGADSLHVLLETLAAKWRIKVRPAPGFDTLDDAPALDFEVRQIIREAVSNAVRHGGADLVEVSLERRKRGIRLELRDNGQGFDSGTQRPRMIAQRVADLGGSMTIHSSSAGTHIEVELPSD
ncbi:ATP-binding protein [Novosphingobium sp. PC22D]|uniref:sensor histidine kinase n=1 Tax=Novosphingobium sp. PC22D TaxID=1962403 RepID=UPI00143A2774|nr:ATP-binding protein [Novosphingobium sp. PC22D]